ncbi:MAG: LacI family transcriptional regulator [Spirochaetales bacterium]|nr:MAG: LacI family transcriptional regulator [Spirochaetales bacterium]
MDKLKATTIDDVAREAGVSKSTVSRALANSPRISEETRRRIVQIKDRLGYEPSNLARGLSLRRTYTVGVLLEDISNSFFTEVAKGIETTLKKAGYTMFLTSTGFSCEEEIRLTRTFLSNGVDGILITPVDENSEALSLLKAQGIPFFVLNNKPEDPAVNWVDTENIKGGYLAAKHLLELGHRKFFILRSVKLKGCRERFSGIEKALGEFGLSVSDQAVAGDANTRSDGYALTRNFFEHSLKGSMPTAVITTNDVVAIGAMEYFFEKGIRIPEDVSIIGYDDISLAGLIRVPLTTIHQPKFTMGEIAAYMLINIIEGQARGLPHQYLLQPHLIVRESTKELKRDQ